MNFQIFNCKIKHKIYNFYYFFIKKKLRYLKFWLKIIINYFKKKQDLIIKTICNKLTYF